jgi:hypothetical protein
MGVDWIPCRAEADCPRDELSELVRREALHFQTNGSSMASLLDPRITFSETEEERIRQAYLEIGPLHRRLLFKNESHRVSVIGSHELFPIEWRIAAERTILPWELSDQLARWQGYREEVSRGEHQSFLRQLYIYVRLRELTVVNLANLMKLVQSSQTATGSWAKRPEVVACREEILAATILTLPSTPRWPDGEGETDLSLVEHAVAKVASLVDAWNRAVQRGNVKLRLPSRPLEFDRWIAAGLENEWYLSFLTWVEPWRQGGYGLYRDCE